ncbi:conserved protein of unknown function [uncultured Woeseiaceae bacterium]|uniref:Nucleotidyl transferase AbiEii/AbiGii toxin family protein n=1 Tax=uncultured Woeseiaceae bacterium TaxID=1983305 RepID=A0A7D9D257_9GAMM|nr:conserved protein of unknown function [uncultured Woeseiaceae bacterium]
MQIDPTYFADVADALGISDPSLVEKDYYAIELLRIVSKVSPPGHALVFAGGTCLAKAHIKTYRMSEDIDIKAVPDEETSQKSLGVKRQIRKAIRSRLEELIESSDEFEICEEPTIRDEYRHQHYQIKYFANYKPIEALRPNLQLEITEANLSDGISTRKIDSLIFENAGIGNGSLTIDCIAVEITAAEKFVSLLRRTAAFARDSEKKDDPTLIRHTYDLHLILESSADTNQIGDLIQSVIEQDAKQFGNQHPEFQRAPHDELKFGLELISAGGVFKERYDNFIGPLVYHPNPPAWEEVLASLNNLASKTI